MIFVTGATGNAGGAVARAAVAMGQPVRALVLTDADAARLPAGVQAATGDLNRPETLHRHLRGVESVFLLSGHDGIGDMLAVMMEAGVQRVVLLSSGAAPSRDLGNALARRHFLWEAAVRNSGLPWTFLRPSSFMSNTLDWAPQLRAGDVVRARCADVPVAAIHPDDLGAVAAVTLGSPGHEGRAYRLTGPEALRPADRVQVLARVLGRDLRFEPQPAEEPCRHENVDESEVLPTVYELTWRQPRTFETWARGRAHAFERSSAAAMSSAAA